MNIGLQTFTARSIMKNEQEINKSFKFFREQSIKHIELAVDYLKLPFNIKTAKTIANIAKRHEIKVESCQIHYKTSSKDIALTAEYMNILGAKIISNSLIDIKLLLKGRGGVLQYCDMLNTLNEGLKARNILLSHHNHHYEFLKYEGESVLNTMRNEFLGLFTLDTYWCQKGGGNILTLLDDFEARVPIIHLRDFQIKPLGLIKGGSDGEIGSGNLPFLEILQKASQKNVKFLMIEQNTKKPKDSIGQSMSYILDIKNKSGI